jgi:general secretion pathway protein I
MHRATDRARGFSLIELLVALAIVALVAAGLLNLAGESTRTAAHLETRALASIVADNLLAQAMLDDEGTLARPADGRTELGTRSWHWRRSATPTGSDGLLRVDIEVVDADGQLAAQAWGFR